MIKLFCLAVLLATSTWCGKVYAQHLPIPCSPELESVFQSDMELMKESLTTFIGDVEGDDSRANGLMVRWLGARDSQDASTLLQRIKDIVDFAFLTTPMCFPFEGTPDAEGEFVVAQVLSDSLYLYLLGDYFELEAEGRFSRAGTLLHELLHLELFGATNSEFEDVYGIGEVLELAASQPELAQDNSRNWEMMFNEFVTGETFSN